MASINLGRQISDAEAARTQWMCKAVLCDAFSDCLRCPAWKNDEEKAWEYIAKCHYKIERFAGIGKQNK